MRAPLLAAIALAIGCKAKLPIEVGAVDFDYGFFVTYPDQGDEPINVSAIFGMKDGNVTFGEPPSLVLSDGEERFVFVAISAEQLHPSFDRTRASELEALKETPPASSVLAVEGIGGELKARTPLPGDVQLLTEDFEDAKTGLRPVIETEFNPFDEITMRIPVEPEYCRIEGQTPLAPFAAANNPLPPGAQPRGVESLVYLDRDRALVASRGYVYLVDRGGTITSTHAAPVWGVVDDPTWLLIDAIYDMAVGPQQPDGSRRIVVVGGDGLNEDPIYGRIWSLVLRGESIEQESPSQILLPPQVECVPTFERPCHMRVFATTFTADGTAWVGGPEGFIFTRSSTATEFRVFAELEHRTDIPDAVYEMMPLSLGRHRMILSLKNHIYLLRDDGRWERQYLMRSGILGPESMRFGSFAVLQDPGQEIDFWAVGDRGQIARRTGDLEWLLLSENQRELLYPPRFAPCASSDDPAGTPRGFIKTITASEGFEDYVHMGHMDCNAVVVVRRSDQCVSLVTTADGEVAFSPSFITTIARLDRSLLVGTAGGELYETTLP